jgi:SAM-dependent methyltransferase
MRRAPSVLEVGASRGRPPMSGPAPDAQRRFDQAVSAVLGAEDRAYDPWLFDYCGNLRDPAEASRYLRYRWDQLGFGRCDPHGLSILEAGCGFGFGLLAFAALGARRADGIDLHAPMVETIRAYSGVLDKGLAGAIGARVGDVAAMPYPDESFGAVVANEAVSHFADVDAFVREAHRVLTPGGALIVFDSNNLRNPSARRRREAWRKAEVAYRSRRAEILAAELGEPRGDVLDELARRTHGFDREALLDAGKRYYARGAWPEARAGAPVDPDTGIVMERPFDPYALARTIRAQGFRTRVAGYWGGSRGNPVVRLANSALSALSPATIVTAKAYRVAAWKI